MEGIELQITNGLVKNIDVVFVSIEKDVKRIITKNKWYFEDFDDVYRLASKMTAQTLMKKHLSSVKRFYECNNNMAVQWLIRRIVSNMRNIGFDRRYKKNNTVKLDELYELLMPRTLDIETLIIFEDLHKLNKSILLQGLQKVWEDAKEDLDFDETDFKELCEKFGCTIGEVMGENTILLKVEQTVGGRQQLVLLFDPNV
ncbi:MAG TPA: hypothetical protein PLM93_01865 [Sulfuricurvum sp.]|nr:MAG: hypothetical protein B7Y30_06990 [Campylobacterales bacterium 16-40-21]OZA03571.1 MAG: hypothetical protein B7X89_02585 [Sulfuricurvum sp. 17-40-25]HQS65916.1 hypothetical protein [Sulfuricurvum sp.]HQT35846.1 hypothetical protein [Sulfuricurvum sp.]